MPNRGIKESICTSETLSMLTAEAERLFYRLIVNCDDFGRMDARAEIIRSKCFSLITDKIAISQIEEWLSELVKVNLIILYENDGKRYLQFVTWDKHNRRRASDSKYPAPDDTDSYLLSYVDSCQQVTANENKSCRTSTSTRDTNTRQLTPKKSYAEFVKMTEDEYNKLVEQYGESAVKRMIEILDDYKGSNGKKYKSDYRAIRKWVSAAYEDELRKNKASPGNKEVLPVL